MSDSIVNVIAAFSEDQVERLTGLTRAQLRHWDRTGFFTPSCSEDDKRLPFSRLYSFRDIVALRTLGVLRIQHNVPLQHLRKVAEKLSHLAGELWTGTTLYVVNRKVVFHEPGTDRPREVVSGQYVMGIALKLIVSDTRRDVEKLNQRSRADHGKIERQRFVNHNSWVVAGTRIPVSAIRDFKEAGYTVKQILEEYPDLTVSDVRAALAHDPRVKAAA